MIPPRSFPKGNLKLIEFLNGKIVQVHAECPSSVSGRARIQRIREDLLILNPRRDLQILENYKIQ